MELGVMMFIIIGILALFLTLIMRKDLSGTKLMLFGINVTILGGILVLDSSSALEGLEYIIVIIGLIISIIGLAKKD